MLGPGEIGQHVIGPLCAPERVETDEPQVAGQGAEVAVDDEPDCAERLRSYTGDTGDVEPLESRLHADSVLVDEPISEPTDAAFA